MVADEVELQIHLQPKQRRLLNAILDRGIDAPTVLGFGGARGAAKSGGVRRIALALAHEQPAVIIWIIRRVWDDLKKDHIDPLFNEYPDFRDYWHAVEHRVLFPNGSSIYFIHAGQSGRAKRKARGPQAHYIFLEQAEEFTQEEMEQLAGSNRAPGVGPGFCKRIYTFNPGGVGTNYLRRIFWMREFRDNENPDDFMFIQGFGWDNFEWFRGLGIVDEWKFYHSKEWTEDRRFETFINQTDFGRKLNALPPSQRIGELMGSFENFSGQYYADVWEQSTLVLDPVVVAKIIKPWWRRWIATDWGFSHWCANGWAATGYLSIEECWNQFGVEAAAPVRIIIVYREAVVQDMAEPDLAKLICALTPPAEKPEVRHHFMGQDAWAKRGSANTVVEQMDPVLSAGDMKMLEKADWDRVGGWRLLYNCWMAARNFRKHAEQRKYIQPKEEFPLLFISGACTEIIAAVPTLQAGDIGQGEDPKDVRKNAGQIEDDVADMLRYLIKSYMTANPTVPNDVTAAETFAKHQDPTARAMAMLRLSVEQKTGQRLQRRRKL